MKTVKVEVYNSNLYNRWNDFVSRANNGTIFHRLDFLSYHSKEFKIHNLVWFKGEELIAVMPLQLVKNEGEITALSPYGASWGGVVIPSGLKLKYALSVVELFVNHLREHGVKKCYVTIPPMCYYQKYDNYIEFALVSNGFKTVNRELTNVLSLNQGSDIQTIYSSSRRTQIRKALKLNISFTDRVAIDELYPVIVDTKKRLGTDKITHSLEDIKKIQSINKSFVRMSVAKLDNKIIAGNFYLVSPTCITSFYPSYIRDYAYTSALSLVIHNDIEWSIRNNKRYFDFGCSSLNMTISNADVNEFKESFGAVGMFRDTYLLNL